MRSGPAGNCPTTAFPKILADAKIRNARILSLPSIGYILPGLTAAILCAIVGLERPTRHISMQHYILWCCLVCAGPGQEMETWPDGAGLYRILAPVLDIVGKRDPGMPALLVDRDRWGWKV